jgi:hypothetical protein
VVDKYFIGETIENHEPRYLASRFDDMLMNTGRMELYKQNLVRAASDLCWENEEKVLMEVLEELKAN